MEKENHGKQQALTSRLISLPSTFPTKTQVLGATLQSTVGLGPADLHSLELLKSMPTQQQQKRKLLCCGMRQVNPLNHD